MSIVEIIDITDAPKIIDDGGTNNIPGGSQQKEQKPAAFKKEMCHMCHSDLAYVSSPPTDAHKQTQKRPRELDVVSTSGSVKRPCMTSDKICTNAFCSVAKAAVSHPALSTSFPITTAVDGDEDDAKAHVRPVVPGETASNAHLTRGEDIVLEEIQSYPQASSETYYYSSTAVQHIFRDRSAFETYAAPTFSSQTNGACVNGTCRSGLLFASGRGTVRVEGRCGDRASSIRLRNVLHIPSSKSNLISGIQLDKAGVTSTLGNGRITLSLRGTNIVDGQICDDMYRLNMS